MAMTKEQRTRMILDRERGKPHEFSRLHVLLCMDFGWEAQDQQKLQELIDGVMIAARMDEIIADVYAVSSQTKRNGADKG